MTAEHLMTLHTPYYDISLSQHKCLYNYFFNSIYEAVYHVLTTNTMPTNTTYLWNTQMSYVVYWEEEMCAIVE